MSIISKTMKVKVGSKAAKAAAKRPGRTAKLLAKVAKVAVPAGKAGIKANKPVVKRRTRKGAEQLGEAARVVGEAALVYGPQAAYELGLAEAPKQKRTAPRLAAGMIVGASAVYFLEPEHGKEHRDKLAQLVG